MTDGRRPGGDRGRGVGARPAGGDRPGAPRAADLRPALPDRHVAGAGAAAQAVLRPRSVRSATSRSSASCSTRRTPGPLRDRELAAVRAELADRLELTRSEVVRGRPRAGSWPTSAAYVDDAGGRSTGDLRPLGAPGGARVPTSGSTAAGRDPVALHRARTAAKRARYAAEVVGKPKRARRLKRRTEGLGIHHDCHVAAARLLSIEVTECRRRRAGPDPGPPRGARGGRAPRSRWVRSRVRRHARTLRGRRPAPRLVPTRPRPTRGTRWAWWPVTPSAPVAKVMFAVDPTLEVAQEAVEWGADLLVVHHPLFLTPVSSVAATTPKGRILHTLTRAAVRC